MSREFDTSGYVSLPTPTPERASMHTATYWPDLNPFTQGYVEAVFADGVSDDPNEGRDPELGYRYPEWDGITFSDLAPETLARIIADCERAPSCYRDFGESSDPKHAGRRLWHEQQDNRLSAFPPLTPYLGDDGKVYLRDCA